MTVLAWAAPGCSLMSSCLMPWRKKSSLKMSTLAKKSWTSFGCTSFDCLEVSFLKKLCLAYGYGLESGCRLGCALYNRFSCS